MNTHTHTHSFTSAKRLADFFAAVTEALIGYFQQNFLGGVYKHTGLVCQWRWMI